MSAARAKKRGLGTPVEPKGRSSHSPASVSPQRPASGLPLSIAGAVFSGRALWFSLGLIAANVIVYAPVRQYGFVSLDDPQYVSENPNVLGGLTWKGVSWAFTTEQTGNWHPLTWLSHMLDVQLYGINAGGQHLTNVLFHIANTLLLFGLLHRMTGALGRSAFVAGLFAVHPLHVESVAWVAERKDVLSALLWMLTLWAYVGYVRRPRLGRYLVVFLLFALGLMAKPMLVTLPFVLLLLDFWPLRRLSLGADSPGRSGWALLWDQRSVVLQLVWEKLPLLALTVASSVLTFVVQRQEGAVSGLATFPLSLRVENALVSYAAYIGKMLWPTRLAVFYPFPRSIPG
ncbi:MAG: glycosyltransferase family 39 protein, partial [Terriglobia bacterium]